MHNKGVSQELAILAARATKLALQKAIDDMADLANEIRTLELGITDADYQDITSLLQAGYEIINSKYGDDSVYTRHHINLLRRGYPLLYFLIDYVI